MESYALVPTNPSLVDEHSDTTLPPTASLNLNELATEAEITTLIQASGNITLVLKSLHWLIVPRRVYYILPNTHNALKPLNFLTFVNHSPSNRPGLLAHHHTCSFLYLGLLNFTNS